MPTWSPHADPLARRNVRLGQIYTGCTSTKSVFHTIVALGAISGFAQAAPSTGAADAVAQCDALSHADFSNIVDAPTQISSAKVVVTSSELLSGIERVVSDAALLSQMKVSLTTVERYCRVLGNVVPSVGFELLLPVEHWNGKFLQVGCGGWCGSTGHVAWACSQHSDYACIGTDMGHTGPGGLWFHNNLQAQLDFDYLATHVTTLVGKVIT